MERKRTPASHVYGALAVALTALTLPLCLHAQETRGSITQIGVKVLF